MGEQLELFEAGKSSWRKRLWRSIPLEIQQEVIGVLPQMGTESARTSRKRTQPFHVLPFAARLRISKGVTTSEIWQESLEIRKEATGSENLLVARLKRPRNGCCSLATLRRGD